jgi:multidrug efflux pump subunit AcrA (membrane-fusion protein)
MNHKKIASRTKRLKTSIKVGLMIVIISVSIFSGCNKDTTENNENDNPKNVRLTTINKSLIEIENTFAGEIKANEETNVIPKTPGKISKIFVEVGDRVKVGDILFSLDSEDLKAQLAQAEAGARIQLENLQKTKSSNYSQSLLQKQTEVNQAKITYDAANEDYIRAQAQYRDIAISKEQFNNYKTSLERAIQSYETAKENLEIFKNTSFQQDVRVAESMYNQAKANVNAINIQINNTDVPSPISGIITKRNINVGEGVSTAAPAVVVSNLDKLKVHMKVPENLINNFTKGQKLDVTVETLDNKKFTGIVDIVFPSIDEYTKNYSINILLSDISSELKPGMITKVKTIVERKDNILIVPNESIVSENNIHYIFVAKENKVTKVPVKLGLSNDKVTEVIDGVKLGDKVVIEGQNLLSDGEKIREF